MILLWDSGRSKSVALGDHFLGQSLVNLGLREILLWERVIQICDSGCRVGWSFTGTETSKSGILGDPSLRENDLRDHSLHGTEISKSGTPAGLSFSLSLYLSIYSREDSHPVSHWIGVAVLSGAVWLSSLERGQLSSLKRGQLSSLDRNGVAVFSGIDR